ncbi:hypothetical protein HY636_05130 [Candidatus Woesearchaeota archaeon]|nr:hypothetical protein [Candidatus Woesearchaeota archaeon]
MSIDNTLTKPTRAKTKEQRIKELEELDCWVFIEMYVGKRGHDYRVWLHNFEMRWMNEFNGDKAYRPTNRWNDGDGEGFIDAMFKGKRYGAKLCKYDGTYSSGIEDDYRTKTGVLIREHYNVDALVDVHNIADNLEEFLKLEGIRYKRTHKTRDPNLRNVYD